MADSDQSIDIVIRTEADLAGARETEAQLQRDIESAKELGEAYTESEMRLESLRSAISQHEAASGSLVAGEVVGGESPSESTRTESDSVTAIPVALIERLATLTQQMAEIFANLASVQEQARQVTGEKSGAQADTDSIPLSGVRNDSLGAEKVLLSSRDRDTRSRPGQGFGLAPFLDETPPGKARPRNAQGGSAFTIAEDAGTSREDGRDFAAALAAQTRSGQGYSERIRIALDRNAELTNSLFSQTLELIESQNRKLGDVDRKILELGNQIKSLKNP